MSPIGAAPSPAAVLTTVATTTAISDQGSPRRTRDISRVASRMPAVTPPARHSGAQAGWSSHAVTAWIACPRTLSPSGRTPRAAGTCCSAMMAAMPRVKPSTTGTGT